MDTSQSLKRPVWQVFRFIHHQDATRLAQRSNTGFTEFVHVATLAEPQQATELFQDHTGGVSRIGFNKQCITMLCGVLTQHHGFA